MSGRGPAAIAAAAAVVLSLAAPSAAPAAGSAACSVQPRIVATRGHVELRRAGALLPAGGAPRRGDELAVGRGGLLALEWEGNRFELSTGTARLECQPIVPQPGSAPTDMLVPDLSSGTLAIISGGSHPLRAVAIAQRATAGATQRGESLALTIARGAVAGLRVTGGRAYLATRSQVPRINVRPTQQGIASASGVRLDTWPFALSPDVRRATAADALPPFWADGGFCSTGCRQPGAIAGWPLRPFHEQHALRAGANEMRPANMHLGIDIMANDGRSVYALSSGTAHIVQSSGDDERVQVGQIVYWHVNHMVREGQHVTAYKTVLGTTKFQFHHLHLSEIVGGRYLNPLRPGGRVLAPWGDSEPPVIGDPRIASDGSAVVDAFDPQSFVPRIYYETPVLAPAAVAWRLYASDGRPLTPLEWALRGSHVLPAQLKSTVYAGGARNPGFTCFVVHLRCIPTWRYRLAGGLTPRIPLAGLAPGRYRLAVYAWDWASNTSARDHWITVGPGGHVAHAAALPAADPRALFDFD